MDQAAREAPGPVTDAVADVAWAEHAVARLSALPGVRRVGLALVEGGGRRLRFTASDRDPAADVAWCHVDAYDDVPLNTAIRTGEPVIGAIAELDERYAEFASRQSEDHLMIAAVPIADDHDVLGGFVLFLDRPARLDAGQPEALAELGRDLGAALRKVRHPREAAPVLAGPVPPAGALVAVHEVAGDRASVRPARHFLRHTLLGWGVDDAAIDAATVCLSEVVTNAVVHAHGACVVRAQLHHGVLTVSARDSGLAGGAQVAPVADPLQVHGRGLQLVEALSTRWGYDIDGDGALVWFALDVSAGPEGFVSGTPTAR